MNIEICADCKGKKTIELFNSVVACTACGGTGKRRAIAKAMTIAQMLAAGRYDYVSPNISDKNFLVNAELFTTEKTKLFHFNCSVATEQIEAAIKKEGYEPAAIEQLLAFGLENPEEQRKYPIVALGSSWVDPVGYRGVPYLGEGASGRSVHLYWVVPGYLRGEYYRFLAVGK